MLRLSRVVVLIGLCANLPWIMVPWYTLTTVTAAAAMGIAVAVVMIAVIAIAFNELVRWVETRCSHWRT